MLLHNSGTWVLCDYGSTTAWSGHHEGSNAILVAEEDIRKHTTPAYRPPEARMHACIVACRCTYVAICQDDTAPGCSSANEQVDRSCSCGWVVAYR